MNEQFYRQIFDKHLNVEVVPSNKAITDWALQVIRLLFPEKSKREFAAVKELKDEFDRLEAELCTIMNATKACDGCDKGNLAGKFFDELPVIYQMLNTDIQAIFEGDPAAITEFEVVRTYPGFFAISIYRLAHCL